MNVLKEVTELLLARSQAGNIVDQDVKYQSEGQFNQVIQVASHDGEYTEKEALGFQVPLGWKQKEWVALLLKPYRERMTQVAMYAIAELYRYDRQLEIENNNEP